MASQEPAEQRLYDLIKDFKSAMLVTRLPDGRMHARPMAVADLERDGQTYFCTRMDTPKVAELEAEPRVVITFQSSSEFATITGTARIVRDRALIDALWSKAWKVWFPKGKDDPALCVIVVDPDEGEFWDNSGYEGLKYMFKAAKAYLKGATPKLDSDQHAKVKL